jgi:hypothetical protein
MTLPDPFSISETAYLKRTYIFLQDNYYDYVSFYLFAAIAAPSTYFSIF